MTVIYELRYGQTLNLSRTLGGHAVVPAADGPIIAHTMSLSRAQAWVRMARRYRAYVEVEFDDNNSDHILAWGNTL